MSNAEFYRREVLPKLPQSLQNTFQRRYPALSFEHNEARITLIDLPILMLVALTATGKSTTLQGLQRYHDVTFSADIPSRRELADYIVIPMAQTLLGEAVRPINDRIERFDYTRHFASLVEGGFAEVYGWMSVPVNNHLVYVAEGIRGQAEISHALKYAPNWQIVELYADPLTRLQRLSTRKDNFDQIVKATKEGDVSYLPQPYCTQAKDALINGQISLQALAILRAEAENYSLLPANLHHPRYHYIDTSQAMPENVTEQTAIILKGMSNAIY